MNSNQKMVFVNNDGFKQVIPVIVDDTEVIAAEEVFCDFGNIESFAAGSVITLFDAQDEVLLLELEGKIKEGYIISPCEVDIDFVLIPKKMTKQQIQEVIQDEDADFWLD